MFYILTLKLNVCTEIVISTEVTKGVLFTSVMLRTERITVYLL